MATSESKAVVPATPEDRFYANMAGLCDHVYNVLQRMMEAKTIDVNMNLVQFASAVITGMPKSKLIEDFIYYTYEHWDKILTKNRSFFLENASAMMSDLPTTNLDSFKAIFDAKTNSGVYLIPDDHEDSQTFWTFFISLVKISIKYIYQTKRPNKVRIGKDEVEYQKDIDWVTLKTKWSLISLT